jgi:hypothetical protein
MMKHHIVLVDMELSFGATMAMDPNPTFSRERCFEILELAERWQSKARVLKIENNQLKAKIFALESEKWKNKVSELERENNNLRSEQSSDVMATKAPRCGLCPHVVRSKVDMLDSTVDTLHPGQPAIPQSINTEQLSN